ICHGLAPSKRKDKQIRIVAKSRNSAIQLTVEDNGVGLDAQGRSGEEHTSMGHRITDKRIDLFNKSYHDHIQWHIENRVGADGAVEGTRAHIAILIGKTHVTEMRREVS